MDHVTYVIKDLQLEPKTKEIKEGINIIKLNISNLQKAFIPRTKSMKDSKIAHP